MIRHAWPVWAASAALLLSPRSSAAVNGFVTRPGYVAEDLHISADTIAVAPDGRFAASRGSTITIYNHAAPAGRAVLATVSIPGFRTLGGIAFQGRDTLLVTDNTFLAGAVYSASISTGAVSTLAEPGTANNAAQVRVRVSDGAAFAVLSNNPGHGVVAAVTPAGLLPFASKLGTGYLGGLAFDAAGNVYVGDTNDPYFMGNAGRILKLSPSGALLGAATLAGGGGKGVYDIGGGNGDYFATTGRTVTRLRGGTATEVGAFTGAYPFPTDVAMDAFGLLVNGNFTDVGGVFRIRPAAPVGGRSDSWRPTLPAGQDHGRQR